MDSLALRELRQLGVGYLLLLFTLKALGHGIFELPAMPEEPGKASVWRLPLVRFLLSWPDFRMVTLAQGLWGAPTPKPTAKHFRPWQPATSDGDWTGRGQWATTKFKEYPPALCAGFGSAFLAVHRAHATGDTLEALERSQP